MIEAKKFKDAMNASMNQNRFTADYPPEDDYNGIRDDFIERRSQEIYETCMESKDDLAEMLWSGFGGKNGEKLMLDFCQSLIDLNKSVTSLAPNARVVNLTLDSMIDEYALYLAEEEIDA